MRAALDSPNLLLSPGGMLNKKGSPKVLTSPGAPLLTPEDAGISRPPALQRRSSYHRRHVQIPPPFTALPVGNCSLRKGPPPLLPSRLQTRNYIFQKPAEGTGENYSGDPEARTLACFSPVGGGVRSGGVWVLPATPCPCLPTLLYDWWLT